MNDRKSKKLEQVRALLAKADSTNFPGEAQVLREKADELMTAYAIEQWQVEEGREDERPEPERRDFDASWYYNMDRGQDLWQLFHAAAFQARCKIVWWHGAYHVPVLGLPADLDYLDQLFTQLMLELVKRIEPKPDPSKSVEENGYNLRSAGCRWPKATELLFRAGQLSVPRTHVGSPAARRSSSSGAEFVTADSPWEDLKDATRDAIKNKLAQKVRAYRRANDLPDYTSVHPEVYARSFSEGFIAEIRRRFRKMRRMEDSPTSEENSMALALRDIRQVVNDAAESMFGKPPKSNAVSRELRTDYRAYGDGAREGAKVNLANSPQERVGGTRKGLNR